MNRLFKMVGLLKAVYGDLTVRQLQVFLEIASSEGKTQFSYARKCNESDALVSRTVEKVLIRKGLCRAGSTNDGRAKAIFLTKAGKELLEALCTS